MMREYTTLVKVIPGGSSSACQEWAKHKLPELNENMAEITSKNSQTDARKKSLATKSTEEIFPSSTWTHAYTDGSATNATENGTKLLGILEAIISNVKIFQHLQSTG